MAKGYLLSNIFQALSSHVVPIFNKRAWSLGRLGALLAALYFIIPLCSLPPLRSGYFAQVESGIFAFWALSAMSFLWLYLLAQKKPFLLKKCVQLPIVWGPIIFGFLTLGLSLFHPLPLRDFVGSGQIGEGGISFLACGGMACLFTIITRIKPYRNLLFFIAVCVGLLISILTILGSMDSPIISWRYWTWAPFFFPDFLAFIDIALVSGYCILRKQLKGLTYLNDFIAFMLFLGIAYYSNNKSLTYGIILAGISTGIIILFPIAWRYFMLKIAFFGLTIFMTVLIIFYDDFSKMLPESLKALGHLSTITSRTWLSKVTLVDIWLTPINAKWIQDVVCGKGWGTFSNISAANMFLIDQVSIFYGKEYQPSWEIVTRDLMHTHNVMTNIFHSIGILGIGLYLYIQNKLINSLSKHIFIIGSTFLIAYQLQLLFWFQFVMTIPFTLYTLSLVCRQASPTFLSNAFKPKLMIVSSCLLISFAGVQAYIMFGYKKGLIQYAYVVHSNTALVEKLTMAPYVHLESYLGSQRQVAIARAYSLALQRELAKSPQHLVIQSEKIVSYLGSLPKGGNYLANNVALNILSELAFKPETLKYFTKDMYTSWEKLAHEHVKFMPFRSDILLPFFNLYQTLGKEKVVMNLTLTILEQNPRDPIALWFTGSSRLKIPEEFDCGMYLLQRSIQFGVERLMPIPQPLKDKVMTYTSSCHQSL